MGYIILLTTLGFISGIAFESLAVGTRVWFGAFLLGASIVYMFLQKRTVAMYVRIFLFLIMCVLGVLVYRMHEASQSWSVLDIQQGENISLSGMVVSEPTREETRTRFVFEESVSGAHIRVSTDPYTTIVFADRLSLSGKIQKPSNDFLKDSGNESFDYVYYLKAQGIGYEIRSPKIETIEHTDEMPVRQRLFKIKHAIIAHIEKYIPRPQSSLASGILLGARDALPESYTEMFIKTGTIHVVALSGYNISIVAEATMKVFSSLLPYMVSVVFGLIAVALFVILSGASATAVRAGIMGSLILVARLIGRPYDIGRAICVTACIMLVFNPYLLFFDRSFQLSFIATLGVVFISPLFEKRMTYISERFGLRSVVATTLAATISVSPFLLVTTGAISLISLPINIVVVPLVPIIMFGTALTGIAGFLLRPIAIIFGVATYGLIKVFLAITTWASTVPFAQVTIDASVGWIMVGIYVVLVWMVARGYEKDDK
ncbi:ComEC/Rec2 family competence protein [Candidatus Nomurabacteria bacterium]|nr:ComEC/Rec2 family competence protein [Candidatus Nomurabacteria bacterium]